MERVSVEESRVDARRCSTASALTGDDGEDHEIINRLKMEALEPLKEDLSEWLVNLLGPIGITCENFLEKLDNGVVLCRLSDLIKTRADAFKNHPPNHKLPAKVKYRPEAASGSWFARDNTANFIEWCKQFGVKSGCLFETEGLVGHREERNVILCLLELARLSIKYGIEPPNIVKMEKEIEKEEKTAGDVSAVKPAGGKTKEVTPKSDKLDKQVKQLCGKCTCQDSCNQVQRLSQGRYSIGGKVVFIRLLKDRHLMVRVGGGWDTLQHYLAMHDPCKVKEFQQGVGTYLHAVGKYKVKGS